MGRALIGVSLISLLTAACVSTEPVTKPNPPSPPVQKYSALPLKNLSKEQITLAQLALKKMNYPIGRVDGIWGPRSASAIRLFENVLGLESANGHLSELNFHYLKERSGIYSISSQPTKANALNARFDNLLASSETPLLVILSKAYTMYARPNPYSKTITELDKGSAIYVVRLQQGWYEIDNGRRARGFIRKTN